MARIFGRLRHIWRDARGVVTIEFAILLPMLVMLFLGAAEVGRYLLLDMKVQTTSAKLADLMTRDRNPTQASLQDAFNAVPTMLRPFAAGSRSLAIVSSVVWDDVDDPPEVAWQLSGGGTLAVASDVGSAGGEADVPAGVLTLGGSAVIVAELVYSYEPWLLGLIGGGELRHRAYFRPRLAGMRTLN